MKKLFTFLKNWNIYIFLFMIVCVQKISLYGVEYANAGSNYNQFIAFRGICICFGLLILINMNWKQWATWWSAAYLAAVMAGSMAARHLGLVEVVFEDVFLLGVIVAAVWGVIFIATLKKLVFERAFARYKTPVWIIWGILAVLLLFFRNTFFYAVFIALCFSCLYLLDLTEVRKNLLYHALCDGLMLSFIRVAYMSLRYRPFDVDRYLGFFVNVNAFGIYLAIVVAALFMKLHWLFKADKGWKRNIGLCIYGFLFFFAFGLECLSYTRTAIVGILLAIAAYAFGALLAGEKIKAVLLRTVLTTVVAVLLVPVVYLPVRYVPAYFDEPILMGNEYDDGKVVAGDPVDSKKYTSFSKFLVRALGKWGIKATIGPYSSMILPVKEISSILVASAGESIILEESHPAVENDGQEDGGQDDNGAEDVVDVTNGRTEIWATYLKLMNLTGHDVGYILNDNDEIAIFHAHNTYLQVAFQYGILTGIAYLAFALLVTLYALAYYIKYYHTRAFAPAPLLAACVYFGAGMTEWCGHPAYNICFFFFAFLFGVFMEKELSLTEIWKQVSVSKKVH